METQQRFVGRTAIVTGAGSGLGRAVAARIAAEGGKVACFDLVADADQCFFSMEWLDGVDLEAFARELLGGDRASTPAAAFERIAPYLREMVEGIEAIHRCEKLHRDVKPSNILIRKDSSAVIAEPPSAGLTPATACLIESLSPQ